MILPQHNERTFWNLPEDLLSEALLPNLPEEVLPDIEYVNPPAKKKRNSGKQPPKQKEK